MKYLCFRDLDLENWANKLETEQQAIIGACIADDAVLKQNGNWIGGEGLQGSDTSVTLRHRNGTVLCTDGPYAETKELLGGLLILEATDMDHAIQLDQHRLYPQGRNSRHRPQQLF